MDKKKLISVAVFMVAGCLGLFAIYHLYQNGKTDGFDRGSIEVSQCHEESRHRKIYKCTGSYTSGVGMMGKDNVSIAISGDEAHKGDVIYDVYPSEFHSKMNADHFVTGKERSSVLYNTPWLSLLLASIVTPIAFIAYSFGAYRKYNS